MARCILFLWLVNMAWGSYWASSGLAQVRDSTARPLINLAILGGIGTGQLYDRGGLDVRAGVTLLQSLYVGGRLGFHQGRDSRTIESTSPEGFFRLQKIKETGTALNFEGEIGYLLRRGRITVLTYVAAGAVAHEIVPSAQEWTFLPNGAVDRNEVRLDELSQTGTNALIAPGVSFYRPFKRDWTFGVDARYIFSNVRSPIIAAILGIYI